MKSLQYHFLLLMTIGLFLDLFVISVPIQQNYIVLTSNHKPDQIKVITKESSVHSINEITAEITKTEMSVGQKKTPTDIPSDNFWEKRIPVPYNKAHWKYITLEESVFESFGTPGPFTVFAIEFVNINEAWIASNFGLLKFENSRLKLIDLNPDQLNLTVQKVKVAPDGNIWIGYSSKNAGNWISSWNQMTEWENYRFPGKVVDITITKKGVIWVAYAASDSSNAGISYFQDKTWHNIKIGNGEKENNTVLAMTATSDGAVWFLTEGNLFRWDGKNWQDYKNNYKYLQYEEGAINQNFLIAGPDNTIWGIDDYTIYHFDGKNWDSYYGSHISSFGLGGIAVSKDGKIWGGNGFIRDGKNYYFTQIPQYSFVNTIQAAPDDSIWYGMHNGILVYDNNEDY